MKALKYFFNRQLIAIALLALTFAVQAQNTNRTQTPVTNPQMEQRLNERLEWIKTHYPERYAKMDEQELEMLREHEMRTMQRTLRQAQGAESVPGTSMSPDGRAGSLSDRNPESAIERTQPGILKPKTLIPIKGVSDNSHVSASDSLALVALYNATDGDNWYTKTNWLTGPVYTWHGIWVTNSSVYEISLWNNNLNGIIPSQTGNLTNLEYLALAGNQLSGIIPTEIGNLSNLEFLYLAANQLSGIIPAEIGNLTNLKGLSLDYNLLTGSIPTEIGNLNNLQYLDLPRNQLSGSIPAEIGNLSNLQGLNLYSNLLSGSIPAEIGNLNNLQYLNLSDTRLTGSIPSEIGNLSNLQGLGLDNNLLTGSIPAEIGNLNNLQYLNLYDNQFIGIIPAEIGNLANLEYLALAGNQLSGIIPTEIGNLANLEYLGLGGNPLSGSIPAEIGNLNNLQSLELIWNELSGNIPAEIGNLANLEYLALAGNQLSGSIPAEIGNLNNLHYLVLSDNQLSGSIPAEIGNLTNLQGLILSDNQLSGSISEEICNLDNLSLFYFQNNYFDMGSCPAIECLINQQVVNSGGIQLNGINLLTDCFSSFSVTPSNQNVAYSPASTTSFTVTSTAAWTAVSDQTWCTVTPSGTGNGTLTANYTVNALSSQRIANITVTVAGVPSVVVTVTQAGNPVYSDIINLNPGWNLISFDVTVNPDSTHLVFAPLIAANNLVTVTGFQNQQGVYYLPPPAPVFFNSLKTLANDEGYWVKVINATTLTVQGQDIPDNFSIQLTTGWNLISWPWGNTTPPVAFANLNPPGVLLMVTGFEIEGYYYNPLDPMFSTLEQIKNGFGYWVKVNSNCTLSF